MSRICVALAALALAVVPAVADTWWYTYEADGTYPEQEGFERNTMGGGAQRWFEDGAFVLDTWADPGIADFYAKGMPSLPDPNDPTHAFVCEWRLRVDSVSGGSNPTLFLLFEGYGDIFLGYQIGRIFSLHEGHFIADFEPGVFHTYCLTTTDMDSYALAIDGTVVYIGEVNPWAPASVVQFGDSATATASVSRWDYLRYGVIAVPEPGSILLCVAAALGLRNRSRRRAR